MRCLPKLDFSFGWARKCEFAPILVLAMVFWKPYLSQMLPLFRFRPKTLHCRKTNVRLVGGADMEIMGAILTDMEKKH